jgi:serine/threonine-protein kinase
MTTESRWIWPFELKEKLGEGGMGVVYRARYVGNDREVALKLLPDDVAANPTILARFEREMEVLKQLRHPNVVHCFGGVCKTKERFYAMEVVEGGTLGDELRKKGRYSWDKVIELGLQMCAGLGYAHEQGVIHRDVKPANFLIGKNGQLKLADFGLATITSGQKITKAGKTVGTFYYMAPEQIRGKPPISARTDLYALGCVLYELLTGDPPYMGDHPAETLQKHVDAPIPHVATKMLDCPPALDALIVDLLAKNPDARPASAAVVARRLEAIALPSRGMTNPSVDHQSVTPSAENFFLKAALGGKPATPHYTGVKSSVAMDSDEEVALAPAASASTQTALVLSLVLVSILLVETWMGLWSASARLSRMETTWRERLVGTEAGLRQQAVATLLEFDRLSDATTQAAADLFDRPEAEARRAGLTLLSKPWKQSQRFAEKAIRLQKSDAEQDVRYQAGEFANAIKKEPQEPGSGFWTRLILWLATLTATTLYLKRDTLRRRVA